MEEKILIGIISIIIIIIIIIRIRIIVSSCV